MTAHTRPPRRRAERPPISRVLLTLLVSVVVTAGACLAGVYAAPESQRPAVAWGAGTAAVLLCAAFVTAVYQTLSVRRVREYAAGLEQEAVRLADDTVPALVARLRDGASAETALAATPQPQDEAYRRLLATIAEEVARGEGLRAAAMSACANAAGRVQALATSMLADLREMEHRHGEEVLGDLLHLDHRTAQAGRLADSIAVLTGARSGRRWSKPIVMESILRGAMGRISAYQRVRLHSTSTVAVAGHAAEGVMHALAELMDNAASFSPPTAEVHVYVEEVPAGAVISVEDAGLVMGEVALRRAERAVSKEPLDLRTLSGTRLGLAVVGSLARKHGLSVSFRPSAHGGTGVVMVIPQELLVEVRRDADRPAVREERARRPVSGAARGPAEGSGAFAAPAPAPEAPTRAPEPASPAADVGESGLPRRRRGQTLAAARATETPRERPAAPPARSPEQAAARFGAFRRAVQRQGSATPPATSPSSSSRQENNT